MTETQPDPQVEPDEDPRRDALRCIECEFRTDDSPGGWYELSDHRTATGHRYEHVKPARKPLTVADIPAGQGAASLYIGADPQDAGTPVVLFKEYDGTLTFIDSYPSEALVEVSAGARAWRDLLAATLPTVTTEED